MSTEVVQSIEQYLYQDAAVLLSAADTADPANEISRRNFFVSLYAMGIEVDFDGLTMADYFNAKTKEIITTVAPETVAQGASPPEYDSRLWRMRYRMLFSSITGMENPYPSIEDINALHQGVSGYHHDLSQQVF